MGEIELWDRAVETWRKWQTDPSLWFTARTLFRRLGGFQLRIGDGTTGYRLAGPKYSGNSKPLQRALITEHDAREIRRYLDHEFPIADRFVETALALPDADREALIQRLGEVFCLHCGSCHLPCYCVADL